MGHEDKRRAGKDQESKSCTIMLNCTHWFLQRSCWKDSHGGVAGVGASEKEVEVMCVGNSFKKLDSGKEESKRAAAKRLWGESNGFQTGIFESILSP